MFSSSLYPVLLHSQLNYHPGGGLINSPKATRKSLMNAAGSESSSKEDFFNHFPEDSFISPTKGESFSIRRFNLIILPQFETYSPTNVSLFVKIIKSAIARILRLYRTKQSTFPPPSLIWKAVSSLTGANMNLTFLQPATMVVPSDPFGSFAISSFNVIGSSVATYLYHKQKA